MTHCLCRQPVVQTELLSALFGKARASMVAGRREAAQRVGELDVQQLADIEARAEDAERLAECLAGATMGDPRDSRGHNDAGIKVDVGGKRRRPHGYSDWAGASGSSSRPISAR